MNVHKIFTFDALFKFFRKPGNTERNELPSDLVIKKAKEEVDSMGIAWNTVSEYARLPDSLERIISAYAETLAKLPERPILYPISALPYSKEETETALKAALIIAQDEGLKNWLRAGLLGLNRFVAEREITEDADKAFSILLGLQKCSTCNEYVSKKDSRCSACQYIFPG